MHQDSTNKGYECELSNAFLLSIHTRAAANRQLPMMYGFSMKTNM